MRRADELERRRLSDTFAALRALPEAPGRQEAVARRVRDELTDLGFAVEGDPLGAVPAGLLCRLPRAPLERVAAGSDGRAGEEAAAPGATPCVLLGARLDADAALLLAVAHRARMEPLPCGVELLFTAGGEELESDPAGAPDPDARRLTSAYGFFFDHPGPLGEVVTCTPATYRLEIELHRRPDAYRALGVSAVGAAGEPAPHSAARDLLTAIARMRDGAATVAVQGVPGVGDEVARVVAVVRALDEREAELAVAALVDRSYDVGNDPRCACDVDVVVTRLAGGLRHGPSQPAVRVAEAALRHQAHEPRRVDGTRATDADRLTAGGVWCVSLARGAEQDGADALLDLTLALLDEAAS